MHAVQGGGQSLENKATPIQQIATGVDQERCGCNLRRRARDGVTIEAVEPGLSHDQTRWAKLCRQELLEPQGCRIASPSELGHENITGLRDQLGERFQLIQVVRQGKRAVNGFSRCACEADRVQAEPLARQKVNHIDVGAFDERGQSFAGRTADLGCLELGAPIDGVVNGRDAKSIFQARQRRLVAGLPQPAQSDDPDPEPLVLRPGQSCLLGHAIHACPHVSFRQHAQSRLTACRFGG